MAGPNRIDRNASAPNRLRRNAQRLSVGGATNTLILSSTGGIVDTSTGLAVNVDGSTIIINGSDQLGVKLTAPGSVGNGGLIATTNGIQVRLSPFFNGLTVNASGQLVVKLADTSLFLDTAVTGGVAANISSTGGLHLISTGAGGIGINLGSTGSTLLFNNTQSPYGFLDLRDQSSTTIFSGPHTGASATPTFKALSTMVDNATITVNGSGQLVASGGGGSSWASTSIPALNDFFGAGAGNSTMSGTDNIGIGPGVLVVDTSGKFNTAIGSGALSANTTANFNTAYGYQALRDTTTGGSNLAFGYQALVQNQTGAFNMAVGASSLFSNISGGFNNAFGGGTLQHNTVGSFNLAFGDSALFSNTTGAFNTALGTNAAQNIVTGNRNTAIGTQAINNNTAGNFNIGVGYQALLSASGSGNIQVGYNDATNGGITTGSNNILIGNDLTALSSTGSNNLDIGNLIFGTSLGTGSTVAGGNVGINTATEFGSGVGAIGIANAGTPPSTNPTGGGVLYVEAGALKFRGSSGTVTVIAPA